MSMDSHSRWVMHAAIILGIVVLFALPFAIPYFATRPMSHDEFRHKLAKP
jgi:hypothetical protein